MTQRIPWKAGSLWPRLKAQSLHGLKTGQLQSIQTNAEYVDDQGVRFLVRILANLSRKEKARSQQGKTKPANPFLPYERDLYVTDISDTHLCLLNKFNVVDHHFLIVTREFESQENWLTLTDFEALVHCLSEVDGLGFFNGGAIAGASQPHKHLQVVPQGILSQSNELPAFPMSLAIASAVADGGVKHSEQLPFQHAIAKLDFPTGDIAGERHFNLAQRYLKCYQTLLSSLGITHNALDNVPWQGKQTAAYNLLCTRHWMMLVPRSQEKHMDISVNALGFAGSLLVKNQEKLEQLKIIGPMALLRSVGHGA